MKVDLGSVEIDDRARRALNARVGAKGLATREDVRRLVRVLLQADVEAGLAELKREERGTGPDAWVAGNE